MLIVNLKATERIIHKHFNFLIKNEEYEEYEGIVLYIQHNAVIHYHYLYLLPRREKRDEKNI